MGRDSQVDGLCGNNLFSYRFLGKGKSMQDLSSLLVRLLQNKHDLGLIPYEDPVCLLYLIIDFKRIAGRLNTL